MNKLLFLFGTIVTLTQYARAEIGLDDVWGTAWTIGNAIIGETTVTPKYAVTDYTWHSAAYTQTNGGPKNYSLYVTRKYHRDLFGQVFYRSSKRIVQGGWYEASSDPFPIEHVNKLNKTCVSYYTNANNEVYTVGSETIETHKETLWIESVNSTGLWPDNGPWTVWLKTAGSKTSCSGSYNFGNYYFWASATLNKSGHEVVSVGTPDCILNYPFYLTHDFYK